MDELLEHIFLKKANSSAEWFSKTLQEIPNLKEKIGKFPDELSFTFMEISVNGEKDLVMAPAEFDFKPDSNGILYMSSLLQALNTLGTLEESLENVEQRISSELFLIVEEEIKKSSEKLKKSHMSRNKMVDKFVLIPTGLNNVSRDEFYFFCPILREMLSVLILKLLVIVYIFKFITETVQKLKPSSAVENTTETPLSLAIQAAFREVKNFATSIIYSYSSPSEVFSNPLSDISEILKNSKLKSTIDNSDLFTFSMSTAEPIVNEIRSMAIKVNEKDRELSKKVASALNIDPYTSSKKDLGHKQIVKPSIQYLQVLYNQIIIFFEIVKGMLPPSEDEGPLNQLNTINQNIIASFEAIIEKEYIPFVENYMIHELVSAFKGSDSSNWIELSDSSSSIINTKCTIGKKSDSILCSYLTFVRLICESCKLIYFIPSHQESFEKIMEQLCDQLLDKSEIKLRDLILVKCSGEEDTSSNLLCFSVQFAKNTEIRSILGQNTLLQGAANVEYNRLLSEKESIVMESLKGDRSIGKNELLFDPKVIRDLALLQRSFEQVQELMFSGTTCPMTRIVRGDEDKNLCLHVYEEGRKTIFKLSSSFDAKLIVFCELLGKLGLTCLFTLHCEIRTHAFYFLDLAFREGSYKLDNVMILSGGGGGITEPDPYILNWTGDLLTLSDSLSDWFPLSKYLFIFDGLSILIDSILVNNFQYIKGINGEGLRKLGTNTTAIIQILTQILPPSQVSLPKSTEYYRLAQIPSDQLMSEIQASTAKFTFLQYRALLDSAYREAFQREESSESARKAFTNNLTTLKYIKGVVSNENEKDKTK